MKSIYIYWGLSINHESIDMDWHHLITESSNKESIAQVRYNDLLTQ